MSRLLARAKVKLDNVESNYEKMGKDEAYRDEVCFDLQQAIEMSLKAIVELNGLPIAENHDLRANLNILNRAGIEVPCKEKIRQMASTLYSWETESRYKDDFEALIEDIDDARDIASKLIEHTNTLLEEVEGLVMEDIPDKKLKRK